MRMLIKTALFFVVLILTFSCEFRPLDELSNTHYVRVYIDEHIKNTTEGFYNPDNVKPEYKRPGVMRVTLADRNTGKVVAERYLRSQGDDEQGHYYDGYIICDPGEWSLLSWNFDTETTQIEESSNQHMAKAFTNKIASHLYSALPSRLNKKADGDDVYRNETIVYEPDHLFVSEAQDVDIKYNMELDTLRTPSGEYFRANTIVEAWYIQVNVKGVSYLSSSLSLITGLSGSKKLYTSDLDSKNPVTLYFDMLGETKSKADDDTGIIYSTFYTFGKLPDIENGFEVTFDIQTIYGTPVTAKFDITDEFQTEMAKEHRWIILDKTIEIPGPPDHGGGGGFSPGVKDWNDVNTDLII